MFLTFPDIVPNASWHQLISGLCTIADWGQVYFEILKSWNLILVYLVVGFASCVWGPDICQVTSEAWSVTHWCQPQYAWVVVAGDAWCHSPSLLGSFSRSFSQLSLLLASTASALKIPVETRAIACWGQGWVKRWSLPYPALTHCSHHHANNPSQRNDADMLFEHLQASWLCIAWLWMSRQILQASWWLWSCWWCTPPLVCSHSSSCHFFTIDSFFTATFRVNMDHCQPLASTTSILHAISTGTHHQNG